MRRTRYQAEHEAFRRSVRAFLEREVIPAQPGRHRDDPVGRAVWIAAGKQGLLGFEAPPEFGGTGLRDFRYNRVLAEETMRVGATGLGFGVHNDIVLPYLLRFGTPEQRERWLPRFCSGELIGAIAMTEPGGGGDHPGVMTTAHHDGADFIVTGAKTFTTNGIQADLVIVVVRTNPTVRPSRGISLLVVERGMPGFKPGPTVEKTQLSAAHGGELVFTDVRVPAANLIGELHQGFQQLISMLPRERLSIAVGAAAAARTVLGLTLRYCQKRSTLGRPAGSFQRNRFALAEMATELESAESYLDQAIEKHRAGRFSTADASMAKWWTAELQKRVIDRCLQLPEGQGYLHEFPLAKTFFGSRIQTIYGGTAEIMKEIISRPLAG